MTRCFFSKFTDTECIHRADGIPDRAHCVPQQRIRQAGERRGWSKQKIAEATWDERVFVPACRRHHGNFDAKLIRLTAGDYPVFMHEWAYEHGFEWMGLRDGWVAIHTEEAA